MKFVRSRSHFLSLSLSLLVLSGCAYVIPPEENAPRNNTVLGEKRKPQLNMNRVGPQSAVSAPMSSMAAPSVDVQAMNLPPVDATTQAQAQQEIAFANTAPVADTGRMVPAENQQFQLAAAEFPPINDVPPRPVMSGPGSAQERLDATKAGLEVDRTRAVNSKKALDVDAAAEPSMLSDLPKTGGTVPASDPVQVRTPEPALNAMPSAVTIPPASEIRRSPSQQPAQQPAPQSALPMAPIAAAAPMAEPAPRIMMPAENYAYTPPPAINFPPPTPLNPQSTPAPVAKREPMPTAPAPMPVAAAPAAMPAIALREPMPPEPVFVPQAPIPAAVAQTTLPPGDFDPLAVADNAPVSAPLPVVRSYGASSSSYVSNVYIAPSRYATRRY